MRFLELMRVVGGGGAWGGGGGDARAAGGSPKLVGFCEDSRKVKAGDLFVARGGTEGEWERNVWGMRWRCGAVAVVVESGQWSVVSGQIGEGVAFALVKNGTLAAAILAHEVAGNPTKGVKMIGVTGTKGKTTVAYLMRLRCSRRRGRWWGWWGRWRLMMGRRSCRRI